MCGIIGALALRPGPTADLRVPLARLTHRGPDGEGLWNDEDCALGHARLAIIDLTAGGHQPMANGDGTVHVTYNGEIYNFQQLRQELQASGHEFRSTSDTEVLVKAYDQWGDGFLDRLRGMFAFGLWDARRRRLLLARDRVGKKPLFWTVQGGQLLFASELQSLLAHPGVSRAVDHEGLFEYLTWGYVPPPRTGFAGISKLPPGNRLVVELGRGDPVADVQPWWKLEYLPKLQLSRREAAEAVRELLTEAVRLRMISDVPLGAFLSGGIDSSIVVGLMAGLSDRPIKTFSIGFDEAGFDELPHARRIAERWGTDHHEVIVRPDATAILPRLVRHFGEPFADSSAVPTYYVSEIARRSVTVALNGDGGDESFAGYERYFGAALAERIARFPGSKPATLAAARLLPGTADPKSRLRSAARFLEVAHQPLPQRYARWQSYFDHDDKRALCGEAFRPFFDQSDTALLDDLFDQASALSAVDAAMSVDVRSYLPHDLLVKVDITSMANSLETRSPFLDQEVMAFAARLPVDLKLRGRQGKHLLRHAFSDLLPRANVARRKMGFGVPVGAWFRGPMRELLRDALLAPEAADRGLLEPGAVRRLLDAHDVGHSDKGPLLWNLLMLELWHRELVDQPATVPGDEPAGRL